MEKNMTDQQDSTLLLDMMVSIQDESTKRERNEGKDASERKAKKRRRSSLCAKRRSIVGNVVTTFQFDPESGNQADRDSESQQSTSADGGQSSQQSTSTDGGQSSQQSTSTDGGQSSQQSTSTDGGQSSQSSTSERNGLLPNPVNLKMDAVIEKITARINLLNDECSEWRKLLKDFEDREEQSRQLAMNLTLPMSDVPAEVKELGMSQYVKCKPLDLLALKSQVSSLLRQNQFNREACIQDLKLIQETAHTVQNANKYLTSQLSKVVEQDTCLDNSMLESKFQPLDSKEIILKVLSST